MRKIQWNHKWNTTDMNRLFYVVTRLFTKTKTKRISRFSKCKTINDRILHSNFCRIRKKEHEQISSKFTKDLNHISTWFKCDRWMMQRFMHDIRHEALHSAEHPSIDGKIGMTLKPPRKNRGRPNVRDRRKFEQTENRTQVNFVKDNFLHINLNMILPIRLYTFMIKNIH